MKIFFRIIFFAGVLLLGFNLTGLFKTLRNPELKTEKTPYKDDLTLTFPEAKKSWDRKPDESEKDYALRATMLVNHVMAHYWKDEGIKRYNLRVPVWENYILCFASLINPDRYRKYEFRNYKKAIERGVGICSQPSIALKGLLMANGIKADLWDIAGHVVVSVTFSDSTGWILDPDYGKYVPYGIEQIEDNPELVRASYKDQNDVYAPWLKKHKTTDDMVKEYEKTGNHIYYMDDSFERFSYIAIWIIPFLLMFPFLFMQLKRKKQ
jgi:hypothetical protein